MAPIFVSPNCPQGLDKLTSGRSFHNPFREALSLPRKLLTNLLLSWHNAFVILDESLWNLPKYLHESAPIRRPSRGRG
jgi:hypothetical protein